MKVNIKLESEQVDAIVLQELQRVLEQRIRNYINDDQWCGDIRKEDRKLIKSLRRTVAYFMVREDFLNYIDGLEWPVGMEPTQKGN
jgi:hypothetical protein